MTIRTCLIIQGNYPDNILVSHVGDTGKVAGTAYLKKNGEIDYLLVSTKAEFDSGEAAEKYLHDTFQAVMEMNIVL